MTYEWKMSFEDVEEVIANVNEQMQNVKELSNHNLKISEYPKGTDNIPGVSALFSEYNSKNNASIDDIVTKLKQLSSLGSDIIEQTKQIELEVRNGVSSAHKITDNSSGVKGSYSFALGDKNTYNDFMSKLDKKYNLSTNDSGVGSSSSVTSTSAAAFGVATGVVSASSSSSSGGTSSTASTTSSSSSTKTKNTTNNSSTSNSSSKKKKSTTSKKKSNSKTTNTTSSSTSSSSTKKSGITASQAVVISLFEKEILSGKSTIQDLVNYMRRVNIKESVIVDYLVGFASKIQRQATSVSSSTKPTTGNSNTAVVNDNNAVSPSNNSNTSSTNNTNNTNNTSNTNNTISNQDLLDVTFDTPLTDEERNSHYFTNTGNVSSENTGVNPTPVSNTPSSNVSNSSGNRSSSVYSNNSKASSGGSIPKEQPNNSQVTSDTTQSNTDSQSITDSIEENTTDLFSIDDEDIEEVSSTTDDTSSSKGGIPVVPIVGGVAAAAAATVGAKIYKDRRDNSDLDLDDDRPSNDNKFWSLDDQQVINSEEDNYLDDEDVEDENIEESQDNEYHASQNNLDDDSWSMPDDSDSQSTFDLLGND